MVTLEHHIVLDTRSAQGGRTVSKRKKKLSQLEGVLTSRIQNNMSIKTNGNGL